MKSKLVLAMLLLSGCNQNKFSGFIHDFDKNKPIKNVVVSVNGNLTKTDSIGHFEIEVNSNSDYVINLKRQGYANKSVLRKPDYIEKTQRGKLKNSAIYMFKKESDFSK